MKCKEIYKGRFKYEKDNEWINYGKRILTNKKSRRTNIWTIEAFYLALGCLDINYIENIENKKVLDFGCGNGRSILDFLKVGIKPENIVGIDALPEYIQFGKNMLSEKISLICDGEIKLEENFFDLVHMFSVDQYIEPKERSKIFHQLESVTKKGGYIFIGSNYWGGGINNKL